MGTDSKILNKTGKKQLSKNQIKNSNNKKQKQKQKQKNEKDKEKEKKTNKTTTTTTKKITTKYIYFFWL